MDNKVIDSQRIFRKILDGLSRPGKIVALDTAFDYRTNLLNETMAVLLTLLDSEVTFHLVGNDAHATAEIEIRTLARTAPIAEADYIIVPSLFNAAEAFEKAKIGTLLDPNQSATIIIETQQLSNDTAYTLTGPGIKDSRTVTIPSANQWLAARNEAVNEFPLGVDCFFIDQAGSCLGLPRTTKIEEVR